MRAGWPQVPLRRLLRLQRRWVVPDPSESYTEIGVRSFGKGIFHKPARTGKSIGSKRVLQILPGDLVINVVFAWEGAVAVARQAEQGTIGSHRFLTFTPNTALCDAEYLRHLFRNSLGLSILQRVSPGAAGRNKTLNVSHFLAQGVPLPPLAQQRRIVELLDEAESIRQAQQKAANRATRILPSLFHRMFGDPGPNTRRWPELAIRAVVERIEAGWSAKGEARTCGAGEFGVLKVSAVTTGSFRRGEHKAVPELGDRGAHELIIPQRGDLLFSRANTRELIAASCVVEEDEERLFLPDKIWRIVTRKELVVPTYLKALFWVPSFRDKFRLRASGTSPSMLNISQGAFLDTVAPIPPLERQLEFDTAYWHLAEVHRTLRGQALLLDRLWKSLCLMCFDGQMTASRRLTGPALLAEELAEQAKILAKEDNEAVG